MSRRLRQEDGFVVATSIIVLLVGLLFTTALIARSMATAQTVHRDGSSKRAVQAARAGVQRGQWRAAALAQRTLSGDPATACATDDGTTLGAGSAMPDGWCPVIGEQLGAGESVRYRVSGDRDGNPANSRIMRDIVAIGAAPVSADRDVYRRVRQRVEAYDARGIFGDYTVVSDLDLSLSSNVEIGSTEVHANIRSNGSIHLSSNVTVCGDATPGPTGTVTEVANVEVCGSTARPERGIELPTVDPAEARTQNDDAAICVPGCPSGVSFSDKALSLGSNATATLTGNTFLLCSLKMSSNATLTFAPADPTKPVRVFIDDPAHCGGTTTSISMSSNTQIATTGTTYPLVQVLVAGANPPTAVTIASNGSIPVELYAPHSTVAFSSNVDSIGGVVGQAVSFSSNINLYPVANPARLDFEVTPTVYPPRDFSECPSVADFPAGDPGAGC